MKITEEMYYRLKITKILNRIECIEQIDIEVLVLKIL